MANDGEAGFPLAEPGLWVELRASEPARFAGRPGLFLDRDGTLMRDTGYPRHPDEVVLIEAMLPVVRAANRRGVAVVIVTNQSGIGRGLLGWNEFAATNGRLIDLLLERGCAVDLVLACAYHEEGAPPYRAAGHSMRKPEPGMILRAAELLSLDLARSIVVGDRARDVEAGRRAGVGEGWLCGDDAVPAAGPPFRLRRLWDRKDFDALVRRIGELAPDAVAEEAVDRANVGRGSQ